jgi:D-serine deaminase-like pyridoxal phosphate-dependent protein
MEQRARAKPIRLASKSVRCRELQQRVLAREGFKGTLAFTLDEALWLSEQGFDDILLAYPTVDRRALRVLGKVTAERPQSAITLMVDCAEQLDLLDRAIGPRAAPIRLCLELDAGYRPLSGRIRIGAKRSPLHTPAQAASLASEIARRDGVRLVGLMAYEAQIAGLGDAPAGRRLRGLAIRCLQAASARELAVRRAAAVDAVSEVSELEFVNGGGTGSLQRTAQERAVTELAGGSGLYGPTLFDAYSAFSPRPAALFALAVVRRPQTGVVTVLGGGYTASGPAERTRLPSPYLPRGLSLDRQEGAGEVQTPLLGRAADALQVGDRVYFRHAKAGELCERFDRLYLIEGDRIVDQVPTYRGEGRCFL